MHMKRQSNWVSEFCDFVCSLFPNSILFDFYFTLLSLALCRAAAVKSLPVHHYSAGYILFPLGSVSPSWFTFENRIPLKLALGCVCSFANYSVAYEETQSNRVSDFRNFVCSKGNPFRLLFYALVHKVYKGCQWKHQTQHKRLKLIISS